MGNLPSTIGNLSSLVYLYLGYNNLTGAIPSTIGNLQQLVTLSIGSNKLSGSIPSQIGKLARLEYFTANPNLLSNLPNEITALTNLSALDIGHNQFCNLSPAVVAWANQYDPG